MAAVGEEKVSVEWWMIVNNVNQTINSLLSVGEHEFDFKLNDGTRCLLVITVRGMSNISDLKSIELLAFRTVNELFAN